ncbi:MAG: iron uptake system component EfeO, partial [Pseudonocardiales bacterium]|nr:iron uptake system component EfeO [Pseudonocardiales bacterium]
MPRPTARSITVSIASLASLALLAGCSGGGPASSGGGTAEGAGSITVNASDTACEVSKAEAPAGKITFEIANKGTKVTEFYLYGTGDRIMGEVENIGPG